MDVYTVGFVIAVLVAFGIGLMVCVDQCAGKIFSILKGTKNE